MTFISRGEVYDGYPMGADCDLDALIVGVMLPNLVVESAIAAVLLLAQTFGFDMPRSEVERVLLPAAAGLGGAGSPVPVSSLAPGTPNETRNE
ncbi:hypothetical protein CH249_25890 [Rhodococcus sp. 05-2255-3B1]|uniref:hypothetical protein n=1 Tax=Rhodococcus sp. 05-2255-3B1 TaxID=2022482 RepID=UPI000B9A7046|nr:hypothetical protein [Rhodococcus sp. 05-2255-3B1]OZE04367.1 hypothetical protein CH249_25890 [Rhodococcus sp. 05-2255-3B1]